MQRQVVVCPDVPKPPIGSQAVRAGDFIFVGGQIASDYRSGLIPEVHSPRAVGNRVVAARLQSDYILSATQKILRAAGSSLAHGVMIDQYVAYPEAASAYLETRAQHVDPSIRPASTHIHLREFLVPKAAVALKLIAVAEEGAAKKEMVFVKDIPRSPGGPFRGGAQGVRAGGFVFVTGQVASDLQAGLVPEVKVSPAFWYGSPIKLQADFVIRRLQMILQDVGSSLQDVVKADVYLTNIQDVWELEEVWRQYFPENPPARTIIPATRLAPVDCIIEINLIALEGDSRMERRRIVAKGVPAPALHQPHAVRAGGLVFISGLYATDSWDGPAAGARVHPDMPYLGSTGRQQTDRILRDMDAICRAAGCRLEDIAWTQNYFTDLRDFQGSLDAWDRHFPSAPPASFVAGVAEAHAVPGCSILIDGVGVIP